MQLIFEDNSVKNIDSKEAVAQALVKLGTSGNSFAILEKDQNEFLQTAVGEKGKFVIEYKLKSGELYESKKKNFTKNEVIDIFEKYYTNNGEADWKAGIEWELFDILEGDNPKEKLPRKKGSILIRTLYWPFLCIGVLLPLLMGYAIVKRYVTTSQYHKTGGIIEGFEHRYRDDTYAPIAHFQVDNNRYKITGFISSNPPAYALNDHVEIIYNKNNPLESLINNFKELWGAALKLMIIGIGFFLVAMFMRRKRGQQQKSPSQQKNKIISR